MTSLFDRAKQVDLLTIARGAGRKLEPYGNGYMILCPVHSEKTPSCFLNTKGPYKGRVKCFGCDFKGSAVDLYAALHGVSEYEAAKVLAGDLGGPWANVQPYTPPAAVPNNQTRAGQYAGLYRAFLDWCKSYGPTDQKRAALGYLTGRGIDRGAIKRAGLVAVPDDREAAKWLADQEGAKQAGLINDRGRFTLSGCPILFPAVDQAGLVMTIQGRKIGTGGGPKYKYLRGVERFPFGAQYLTLQPGRVFLVEGPTDAISIAELMRAPAIALGGLTIPQAALGLLKGRTCILTPDADQAGENRYQALAKILRGAGLVVLRGRLEAGLKDAGDKLISSDRGKLAAMQAENKALQSLINDFGLKLS